MVVLVSGGIAFKSKPELITETPIMIEFVSEEKTQTSKKEDNVKPIEDTPPPIEDKPQPAPKALEQPKPNVEKAEITEEAPVERIKPTEPIKPEQPKKVAEKPTEKPKPKKTPKKEVKKEDVEKPDKKETTTGFASVLKNLADTQPVDTTRDGPTLTQSPTIDRVTAGELGAFQQQIYGCWNLLPGAASADSLAVVLTLSVNKDRTVNSVKVVDENRYKTDGVFKAAADNAMRALRHPDCTPLDLPIYKYDQWKTITLNFDPQGMF